jgi:hypothetical protein
MKTVHAALAVVAACAALSLAPMQAGAHGRGFGVRAGHVGLFRFAPRFRFRTTLQPRGFRPDVLHRSWPRSWRRFSPWPGYGGAFVVPQAAAPAASFTQPKAPVPIKSCRYLKQTVTVPSETGGSAQITITRC